MADISVLIVDDEQFVCESLMLKIAQLRHDVGYLCTSCNSAREALRALQGQSFDLIITDIRMPFVTGLELIAKIRAAGVRAKIIVLSGYDDFEYVRKAFLNGADDYMLKPIAVSELDKKLLGLGKLSPAHGEGQAVPAPQAPQSIVEYAIRYIKENYTNPTISMDDVARHVSVSYSHFSNIFNKETGTTFPAYLRGLRIEKAIQLLADPGMKISEVCYLVGYKYPQQLSNEFKKVTGVYPSEYFSERK